MEVHKHTQHSNHKKKWKEYFLEFFMLFLAVFLGFIAENTREHIVEKKRAKEYLQAYKNDLIENQSVYIKYDSIFSYLLPIYDSITMIYYEKRENTDLPLLSRLLSKGKKTINVPVRSTAYSQMVNSGSLRLLKNKDLIVKMSAYNDEIIKFKEFDIQLKGVRSNLYTEVLKIEDLHDFFLFDEKGISIPGHIPKMDPFPILSLEQRRVLINYYKLYISQTISELWSMRNLLEFNKKLLDLIKDE